MATNIDINKMWKENPNFRIAAVLVLLLLGYLILNGKHNKIGPVEVAIPNNKFDTNMNNDNKYRNQENTINKVEGDAVFGNKAINYGRDTSDNKPKK